MMGGMLLVCFAAGLCEQVFYSREQEKPQGTACPPHGVPLAGPALPCRSISEPVCSLRSTSRCGSRVLWPGLAEDIQGCGGFL